MPLFVGLKIIRWRVTRSTTAKGCHPSRDYLSYEPKLVSLSGREFELRTPGDMFDDSSSQVPSRLGLLERPF